MQKQDHTTSEASQSKPSRIELEQHVRARAWKDDAFRQEFLANPKAVLERDYAQCLFEGQVPSDISIKVIEEEEQTLYFVLPPKLSADQLAQLESIENEDLLEVAVGGGWTDNYMACSGLSSCVGGTNNHCCGEARKIATRFRL